MTKNMSSYTTFATSSYASADIQLFRDIAQIDRLIGDFAVRRVVAGESLPAVVGGNALLYVVLQGSLTVAMNVHSYQMNGTTKVCCEALRGDCVGAHSVLGGERRNVHICAIQTTDVLVIDSTGLWMLIHEVDGFARKLLALRSSALPVDEQRSGDIEVRSRLAKKPRSLINFRHGLESRAWLDEHLGDVLSEAHKTANPFSVLMIRIDCVPHFAQHYDNQARDAAFQAISGTILDSLRPSDVAIHYDDNHIVLTLPNANAQGAMMVAQRISAYIDSIVVFPEQQDALPHITGSFGGASLAAEQNAADLIHAAIVALDQVKSL